MGKILGMMVLLVGVSGLALATPAECKENGCHAPEINASSASSALALLSGAVLVIRGRRGK